jgi:hypothetical protein
VAATGIPRITANGRTDVVETVGVRGVQSSDGKEGAGGRGLVRTPSGAAVADVVVLRSLRRGEAVPPSAMEALRQMRGNESDGRGDE